MADINLHKPVAWMFFVSESSNGLVSCFADAVYAFVVSVNIALILFFFFAFVTQALYDGLTLSSPSIGVSSEMDDSYVELDVLGRRATLSRRTDTACIPLSGAADCNKKRHRQPN